MPADGAHGFHISMLDDRLLNLVLDNDTKYMVNGNQAKRNETIQLNNSIHRMEYQFFPLLFK